MRLAPLLTGVWVTLALAAISAAVVPPWGAPDRSPPAGPAVTCRVWRNIPGAQITDTLAGNDISRRADETRSIDKLEFSPDFKDAWACSLTALVTVPATGAYRFHIASRDSGLLFFSSDENPAHRRFIAETPASTDLHSYSYYSAQNSDWINLVAGHRYFIQAISKNDPGHGPSGGVSIGWTQPGQSNPAPIPASWLRPVVDDSPLPSLRVDDFKLSLKPETASTTQPGIRRYVRGADMQVNGRSAEMSYVMFMPKDFFTAQGTCPMLVFLHGNNRQGYDLTGAEMTGPIRQIERDTQLRNWMPMVLLSPQLPPEWRWDTPGAAHAVNALVAQLCARYPHIDPKRIYLTGLSMGGKGTWLTLENSPQTYAAVVPISAVDVRPDAAPDMLKDLPYLHIVCGGKDGGFTLGSHRMYESLQSTLNDRVQLTVYTSEGHNVWDHYYAYQSFYEDLMRFSRP